MFLVSFTAMGRIYLIGPKFQLVNYLVYKLIAFLSMFINVSMIKC